MGLGEHLGARSCLGAFGCLEQCACLAGRGRDTLLFHSPQGQRRCCGRGSSLGAGAIQAHWERFGRPWVPRAACLLGRDGEGSSRVGGSPWGFPFIPTEGVQGCWGMGRGLGAKLGTVWVPLGIQSSVPARLEEEGPLRGLEDPAGNPPGVPIALDPRESSGARGWGICLLGAPLPSVALSTLPLSHLPFVLWGALLFRDSPPPLLTPNTCGSSAREEWGGSCGVPGIGNCLADPCPWALGSFLRPPG